MKLQTFLSAVVLVTFAVRGVSAADEITSERYPDADTVVVDDQIDVEYKADGTFVLTDEEWMKALTEKGRRSLSTATIGYSRRYGGGEIVSVEIIGTNGVARTVDFAATLKEATDNSSMSANIYDPMVKKLSCAVPGLEVGETRHIRYRRWEDKAQVPNHFSDNELLEYSMPIVKTTVTVTGPKERPLQSVVLRHPLGNVTTSVEDLPDGRVRHAWTVKDSPQAFPEPDMPPLENQVQNLLVSTSKDWSEISKWYWDISYPHLLKTNAAMTNKVEELGRDMRSIFTFVSQEIRYMGLTMEDTSPGSEPHDVSLTFDNRYGVCRDKAALLVAMLRIAGFEAYPVLINASPAKLDDEVPTPFFNHAIVAVKENGKYILMDPTDEAASNFLPPYLCDCSYVVAHPDGETLKTSPVEDPELNAVRVTGRGQLAKDGSLLVDYAAEFAGINDTVFRHGLLRRKPEDRRKLFERILTGALAGAELLKFELKPADLRDTATPMSVALLAKFPEALVKGATQDALSVPSLSAELGVANWVLGGSTSLESRKYPLKLRSTAATYETLTIDLGGAVGAIREQPQDERIDGKYAFTRSYIVTNGVLELNRRLAIGAVEFSPEEYQVLREGIKKVEACERGACVFAKDRFANADVHYLRRERDVHLTDAHSWVATNVIEKEILTYDGKKSSAELKFGYNPTWKSVEIVSAVVSNRDGKVSRLTDKEINVMDADWVASAPRYPASKQLVANLPSVEIGSVISYTVVTSVSNSPLPYLETFFEDVFEPTDLLVNRFTDGAETWERRVENPKVLPNELMRPDGVLWRNCRTISCGDFAAWAKRLLPAAKVKAVDPVRVGALGDRALPGAEGVKEIRDWMAKNVRIVGPGFGEIRLEDHLTDPETILKERYATRVGYIRTLCALLKGAGFDADLVFASDDAADAAESLAFDEANRNVGAFTHSLCRVQVKEGGFLGFGGTRHTYYLGLENEYTPIAATAYDGCRFLDPRRFDGTYGTVAAETEAFAAATACIYRMSVRENGSVDVDYEETRRGAPVGTFRKGYAEILPEMRSRHYQKILGNLAQAASATSDLVTDVESYPAKLSFAAYIPNYATVQGETLTLELPMLLERLFPLTGSLRETPLRLPATAADETVVEVEFPTGYTRVEHLPSAFSFGDRYLYEVGKISVNDRGRLSVRLSRRTLKQREKMLTRDNLALLKDWSRLSSSAAEHTITVRK